QSFALSASTAALTGAVAIFIAMIGVGTRRTIFSFYLVIGLYLVSLYLLSRWSGTWLEASPANALGRRMSWLAPLHPFLALEVVLHQVAPPLPGRLDEWPSPVRFALSDPAGCYVTWTLLLAVFLTMVSVLFVRRGAKAGEPNRWTRIVDRLLPRRRSNTLTRAPRPVWKNPVAWREARVRTIGGGLMRLAVTGLGIAGPAGLWITYLRGDTAYATTATWLSAVMIVQFALALIVATNVAATSITREKESHTLDLLLTTPLTSRYILWGKLRGLLTFALPLLLGPALVLVAFAVADGLRGRQPPLVGIETALCLAALLTVYTAGACVLGVRISLSAKRNVTAVMNSIGGIILLTGVFSMLGFAFVDASGGEFSAFLAPFTPFTAVRYLVDLGALFPSAKEFYDNVATARSAALLGSAIALGLYAFAVWRAYAALVQNFHMTLRRQSAQG
ncbi:MAG: hypothetical protein D6788_05040, partial [Planctomycetota bacterium]